MSTPEAVIAICGALCVIGLVTGFPRLIRVLRNERERAQREAAFLDGALADSRHYASGQDANFDHFTGTLDDFIAAGGLRSEPQA